GFQRRVDDVAPRWAVAQALDAEAEVPVPGELGEQSTGDALDLEGVHAVLDDAVVVVGEDGLAEVVLVGAALGAGLVPGAVAASAGLLVDEVGVGDAAQVLVRGFEPLEPAGVDDLGLADERDL